MRKRDRQHLCVQRFFKFFIFYVLTLLVRRCDCVNCLGTLTQSHRTRQRHLQKYGRSQQLPQDLTDQTQHARIQAPPSPAGDSHCDNDDTMSNVPSNGDQHDPDYEPINQQLSEFNPTESESDSDNFHPEDLDSSDDERPILQNIDESSDGSTEDTFQSQAHIIFQGDVCVGITLFNSVFIDGHSPEEDSTELGMSFMLQTATTCPISVRQLTLRAWQIRNKVSSKAMQDFLKIAPSIGLNGFPPDWRSVIRLDRRLHHSTKVSEVVEVCSSCFLHRFPPDEIAHARKCSHCSYSRLFCPRCNYRCILGSSIGNKSRKYIAHCIACGANSGVKVTIRSYIFDVAEHVAFMFGNEKKAWSLLQPFMHESEKLFSLESPVTGLSHYEPCNGLLMDIPVKMSIRSPDF